jgi:hypothetical protein
MCDFAVSGKREICVFTDADDDDIKTPVADNTDVESVDNRQLTVNKDQTRVSCSSSSEKGISDRLVDTVMTPSSGDEADCTHQTTGRVPLSPADSELSRAAVHGISGTATSYGESTSGDRRFDGGSVSRSARSARPEVECGFGRTMTSSSSSPFQLQQQNHSMTSLPQPQQPDLMQINATLWNIYRQQLFQLDMLRHLQQQLLACAASAGVGSQSSHGFAAMSAAHSLSSGFAMRFDNSSDVAGSEHTAESVKLPGLSTADRKPLFSPATGINGLS